MFKWIDNTACTLHLYFLNDVPFVCGEVRTFSKTNWIEFKNKMEELQESLRQEKFKQVFSCIKKDQKNILKFEQRIGFRVISEDIENIFLVKDL